MLRQAKNVNTRTVNIQQWGHSLQVILPYNFPIFYYKIFLDYFLLQYKEISPVVEEVSELSEERIKWELLLHKQLYKVKQKEPEARFLGQGVTKGSVTGRKR